MTDPLLHARMKRVRGRRHFQADLDIQRERLREALVKFVALTRLMVETKVTVYDGHTLFARWDLPIDAIHMGRRDAFVGMMEEAIHGLSDALARKLLDNAGLPR